jgi:hypothetical protein
VCFPHPTRLAAGRDGRPAALFGVLSRETAAVAHLASAVATFFIDVEDGDPYAKDSRRTHASTIITALWRHPEHAAALARMARAEEYTFLRFGLLMINDGVAFCTDGPGVVEWGWF